MHIEDMTIEQLRARAAEIRGLVNTATDEELEALDQEATQIAERLAQVERETRRRQIAERVVDGDGTTRRGFAEPTGAGNDIPGIDSTEYRVAYLRALQGRELSPREQRAYTVAGGATATITANRIMDVVRQHAPLLERCTTIYANGKMEYYIEGTNNEATDHTENQPIDVAADTVNKIVLTPSEITKLVQVSASAATMSIDAFEDWLVAHLGAAIARKITGKILTAMMASASSAGSSIDATTVAALLGKVKGFDIALVCNNLMLYTKLLPLQDKAKNNLVTFDGNVPRIYGRPVLLDDHMQDDELLCGDMSKFVCEVAEDVDVKKQYDIKTNSDYFLGVTTFDGKVGIAAGFAKIAGA